MTVAWVLAQKDLRLLLRDRGALFWAGVFPLVFALLFGAIFPSDPGSQRIPVAIVEDGTPAVAALGRGLESAGGLVVTRTTLEAGEARVRRGEVVAIIGITDGAFELGVDPARPAEAAWIEAAVARSANAGAAAAIRRRSVAGTLAPRTGFELAFPASVLWGLIGCAGAFAAASVAERRSGTQLRLRASPAPLGALLGGKFLACLLACVIDAALLVSIAHLAFGVRVERLFELALAVVACAVAFAGLTVLLGLLGRSEQAVGGAGWAALLLFAMIGGAMVPISVMPDWMRMLSDLSPVKWGIVALEGATFRAVPLADLWPPLAVLLAFGSGSFGIGALLARRLTA